MAQGGTAGTGRVPGRQEERMMSEDRLEALQEARVRARHDWLFAQALWGDEDERTQYLRYLAARAYRDYLDARTDLGRVVRGSGEWAIVEL